MSSHFGRSMRGIRRGISEQERPQSSERQGFRSSGNAVLPDGPMKLLNSGRTDCRRPGSTVLQEGERMSKGSGRIMRESRNSSIVLKRLQNNGSLASRG